MALIKCKECGKEISDKAKKCIHCGIALKDDGNKVTNNDNKKKNKAVKIIVGIILLVVAIFSVVIAINKDLSNEIFGGVSERVVNIHIFYKDECSHCDNAIHYIQNNFSKKSTLTYYNLDSEEELFDKVNTHFKLENDAVPLIVINDKYIVGYDEEKLKTIITQEKEKYKNFTEEEKVQFDIVENIKNGTLEVEDTRTAKEKLVDYLKKYQNATCTDTKCTYTFKVLNDTSYYTIDFTSKKYTLQNYSSGNSYTEYNYGKNTGYAKDVTTLAWTVTTEVNVTFDEVKNEYNYKWTSSMQGVDSVAETMASQVASLHNSFIRWCNEIGINPSDI